MRCLAVIYLLLFSFPCMAMSVDEKISSDCGQRSISSGTIFSFTIDRSFRPSLTFVLCQKTEPNQSFLLIRSELENDSANKKITLNDGQFMELMGLYENALTYNAKDMQTIGIDGSTWCLETKRGLNYSKACFYTPSYNTNERGLSGMNRLGVELWRIGNLDAVAGKLF